MTPLACLLPDDGDDSVDEPLPPFDVGGVDVNELRPAIIAIAERVLTTKQLRIFVEHFFVGRSLAEIGVELDVSRQAVRTALNGQRGVGGIMKRMGAAMADDKDFQDTINELKKPARKKAKGSDVVGWYRGCRGEDFVALAVLHYANALADAKSTVSVGSLYEHMPKAIVNQAVTLLRIRGWIATDGITVAILKTPQLLQEN
jgi:predicted DNA-binding protein YlxM (UPF0122 family)